MARGGPRSPITEEHLGLSKPLKVPNINFGGSFANTEEGKPLVISNNQRDLLKKLTNENPELADW